MVATSIIINKITNKHCCRANGGWMANNVSVPLHQNSHLAMGNRLIPQPSDGTECFAFATWFTGKELGGKGCLGVAGHSLKVTIS